MKPTYRIKDWDEHFETNESRKVRNARWVPVPNKHDGKGYRRIAQDKNGVAIFCGWNLILQVASKTPVRGVLADHDGPLDADDLSMKTGFPAYVFEQALSFLSDERIGWLTHDSPKREKPARAADRPVGSAGTSATTRAEGKGREGNGIEEKDTSAFAVLMKYHADKSETPILDGGKQGKAIKRILAAGHSVDSALAAYEWVSTWSDAPDWSVVQGKIGPWLAQRRNGSKKHQAGADHPSETELTEQQLAAPEISDEELASLGVVY
jgi:hypothetical protein